MIHQRAYKGEEKIRGDQTESRSGRRRRSSPENCELAKQKTNWVRDRNILITGGERVRKGAYHGEASDRGGWRRSTEARGGDDRRGDDPIDEPTRRGAGRPRRKHTMPETRAIGGGVTEEGEFRCDGDG